MTKKPCFMTRLLAAVLAVVMLSSADLSLRSKPIMTAPARTAPSAIKSVSARIC